MSGKRLTKLADDILCNWTIRLLIDENNATLRCNADTDEACAGVKYFIARLLTLLL
jgi:hypothetical protein